MPLIEPLSTRSFANLRLVYFAQNLARLGLPGFVHRARLRPELERLDPDQLALVLQRAAYCHRAVGPFELADSADRWRWSLFKKQRNYAFDLVEHLRWFESGLRVAFRFGDDTSVPAAPTLVKARPIVGDVANSVLFPLNKVRHLRFVRDRRRFSDKRDQVVWRGKGRQPQRRSLLQALHGAPGCDVARIDDPDGDGAYVAPFLSVEAQLESKFVLSVEGNDVATNLKWILSSNSVCLMPRPRFETWFQEGLLEPGRHYVEVAPDFSDVREKVREYARQPARAEEIIRAANAHCARFQDARIERATALVVLLRYFAGSGQISPDGFERYLPVGDAASAAPRRAVARRAVARERRSAPRGLAEFDS